MKTIFRRIFAAVLSLGVLASAADLRASAAGDNCDGTHSGASPWDKSTPMTTDGSYYLDDDVTLDDEIVIKANVTICLYGHKITANGTSRIFDIQSGSLTLCDCDGRGEITGGNVNGYGGNGGTSGGAVYVGNNGKFILMNGNITRSSAEKGGGVYVDSGGEFTMHGGIISDNTAIKNTTVNPNTGGDGGGVYVHKGEGGKSRGVFTMSGGTIINNESKHQGGGVYVCGNDGEFTMSGGVIKENNSPEGGGVYTGGTFTMSGSNSEIFGNTATSSYGGGVCVSGDNAKFTMESGTLSDNKAYNGGGVYVSTKGKVEIKGGTIGGGNEAGNNGGGVFIAKGDGEITMSDGKISNNKSKNGGGIYLTGGAFTMTGGEVSNNTADNKGCCVFMSDDEYNGKKGGTMTLDGTVTLTSNPKTDGKKSNVFLKHNKTITIGANFAITANDIIGIHPEKDPNCVDHIPVTTFDNGVNPNADIQANFSADREGQTILYDETENKVKLKGGHVYGNTWNINETTHSNTCTKCGYILRDELHNFNDGEITKQPTYTREGEKTYTCLTCGYKKTEPIPLKVSDDDDDDDYYYNNDNNSQNAVPYNPPMGITISIAPTALAALGIAVVIIRRKMNK